MQIININGPINSGKTTISKLLVKHLPNALFIEVDDLLSDEEQKKLNLSLTEGWAERTHRLSDIIKDEKLKQNYENIIFAYPITENLYKEWKNFEDKNTFFINITLSPSLKVCIQNRGNRKLNSWEINRIEEMYKQGYQNPPFSDIIIDNSNQTPLETLSSILTFLENIKQVPTHNK